MKTKIRLRRLGAKKRPFYRIVVTPKAAACNGKFIDSLGYFNPITEEDEFKVDEEKALEWLLNGAQPSQTVRQLFAKLGIMKKFNKAKQEKK